MSPSTRGGIADWRRSKSGMATAWCESRTTGAFSCRVSAGSCAAATAWRWAGRRLRDAGLAMRPVEAPSIRTSTARAVALVAAHPGVPAQPMGWSIGLDEVAEPADIWHGMWAGSLPASPGCAGSTAGGPSTTVATCSCARGSSPDSAARPEPAGMGRTALGTRGRPRADRQRRLRGAPRGSAAGRRGRRSSMNCREIWTPPSPRPDLIREALGLPADDRDRPVPGHPDDGAGHRAGHGRDPRGPVGGPGADGLRARSRTASPTRVSRPPYLGRVLLLPAGPARGAADLDGLGRRAGHGHPADDAQPSVHDAAEAVREHRRRASRSWRRTCPGWPRSSARPAPASSATRRRRPASPEPSRPS